MVSTSDMPTAVDSLSTVTGTPRIWHNLHGAQHNMQAGMMQRASAAVFHNSAKQHQLFLGNGF